MTFLLEGLLLYYGLTVFWYWRLLLAAGQSAPAPEPLGDDDQKLPYMVVVVPCLNAAESIPGMMQALKTQKYPADRFRSILLIDSERPNDNSASIARAAGAEVFERYQPRIRTKGAAINELLENFRREPWDSLLILDIDARLPPDFLRRVAAWRRRGAGVIQTVPVSRNAEESPLSRINHAGQVLAQVIQKGRTALGWSAILCGGGMVLSRESLEKLDWQTSTGDHLSDDGELNLRCALLDLPVTYGDDLTFWNDLAADSREVRLQRRRWFAAYTQLWPEIGPLLRKGLAGQWRALETLFSLLFLPGCSISFALAGLGIAAWTAWDAAHAGRNPWLFALIGLWLLHGLYYVKALRTAGLFFGWAELKALPKFLWIRLLALVDGVILGGRSNPGQYSIPSNHRG